MQPISKDQIDAFLAKLHLELKKSERLDSERGPWIVVDSAGNSWSGPFWSVSDFTFWLFEHCAYMLNEAEKFKRFVHAYGLVSEARRVSLETDLREYRIGRTPEEFSQLFKGIGCTPDQLPSDWQERIVSLLMGQDLEVEFAHRASAYLLEKSLR